MLIMYRSNTNCAPAPRPEAHDLYPDPLPLHEHALPHVLPWLANARQRYLVAHPIGVPAHDLGYTQGCLQSRPTWTLLSVFAANISIIIVVSSYCGYFSNPPKIDDNETAHQKIVNILLELLSTPNYFSSIFICM